MGEGEDEVCVKAEGSGLWCGSGLTVVQVPVTVKAVTDFVSFQNGFGKTAFWLFLLLKVANKLY